MARFSLSQTQITSRGVRGARLVKLAAGSFTAGWCGSLWPEGLPLADLLGHLSLLALVRRLFPSAPKVFESGFHKSGSP
jgi:hypothetical protein